METTAAQWFEANTIATVIAACVGMAGLGGAVWRHMTNKHRRLEERLEGDTKAWRDHVDADTQHNTQELMVVKSRLDRIEGRLNDSDARFHRLEQTLQTLLNGQGELKGKLDTLIVRFNGGP